MDGSTSIESQPLYQLGTWVNGLIDGAAGAAVGLLDRTTQRPGDLVTLIALAGLACAVLAWLMGSLFARLNRPPRREASSPPPPAAAPAVVIQTGRATRVSRAAPVRRSTFPRPKRHPRRRQGNPILRWLGRR